uniref:Oxidoreductase family protein n=1 Tax=Populus alba TaxID=43335 RepID=A0A4U5MWD9_POPAL|nr:oxidoreductase family protein [Populus alba]
MARKLMHALQYDSYGGGAAGLKHAEVPVPSAKKDEQYSVFAEHAFTHTRRICFLAAKISIATALDIAGEVVAVGPGVEDFKTGDKVVAVLGASSGGGLAEFAVAKKSLSVARPPEVSAAEAAGLPIAGLTAYEALTKCAGVQLDGSGIQKNILITAASGGVGHYAVQLAKLGNTYVTATCGARNLEFVRDLGADEVLDYKTPEGAALKSPSGKKYDAVIHCAPGSPGIPWSTFEPNLSENGKVIRTYIS